MGFSEKRSELGCISHNSFSDHMGTTRYPSGSRNAFCAHLSCHSVQKTWAPELRLIGFTVILLSPEFSSPSCKCVRWRRQASQGVSWHCPASCPSKSQRCFCRAPVPMSTHRKNQIASVSAEQVVLTPTPWMPWEDRQSWGQLVTLWSTT